ncbi:hypothetical protein QBC44DRAFT_327125, partial [Cladorrhinum sp. PSN332]
MMMCVVRCVFFSVFFFVFFCGSFKRNVHDTTFCGCIFFSVLLMVKTESERERERVCAICVCGSHFFFLWARRVRVILHMYPFFSILTFM